MSRPNPQISVSGVKIRESERAVLFRVEEVSGTPLEDAVTEWFPFSQITKMTYSTEAEHMMEKKDTLVISEWIAKQKGLV